MAARDAWQKEQEAIYLYGALARSEPHTDQRALFARLAEEARGQAAIWAAESAREGDAAPLVFTPSRRVRLIAGLARRLRPERLRHALAAMKVRGLSVYGSAAVDHALPRTAEEIGKRHRGVASSNLRAAVFGANDGLVSNASLILGIAGAVSTSTGDGGSHAVLLAGAAGLLAGAFSMAAGEFVSVSSQRELVEHQIAAEREELARYPQEEAAELAMIYRARGLPAEDADRVAALVVANPVFALDALSREELGVDPASLGSPGGAAVSSFFSFAVGALVPLAPFLVSSGSSALLAAVVLTTSALFSMGAAISLFSGRGALRGGLRMLLIGGAAAAATFLIGRALGVAVS